MICKFACTKPTITGKQVKLEHKNEELQKNRKLHNFLNVMIQTLKKFFNKLLHIGTEKDKDDVIKEITSYHSLDYYMILTYKRMLMVHLEKKK